MMSSKFYLDTSSTHQVIDHESNDGPGLVNHGAAVDPKLGEYFISHPGTHFHDYSLFVIDKDLAA
jgi:hypothetical protein